MKRLAKAFELSQIAEFAVSGKDLLYTLLLCKLKY
jgi:hypothetical protein